MKAKKLIALLTTATLLTVLAAGCGESSNGTSQADADTSSGTLTYWGWIPYNNVVEPMKEAVKKVDSSIDMEVQIMDWSAYWDKLTLDLSNGEGPDIFAMNLDNYDKYKDYMEPLDDLAAEVMGDDWKSQFNSEMLESTYVEDQLKIFPADFGGQWYIYYNKTLLDELGQTVPQTYSEYVEYAEAVQDKTIPVIFGGKEAANCAYLYLWLANNVDEGCVSKAADGEIGFDSDAFITAFEDLQTMIDDNVIPESSFGIDPNTDQDTLFKDRKSPMVLVSVGRFSPFRVGLKTPISVNLKSPMHHVCY